ncbi:hypothetical protein DFJ77DRAFT_202338 [Powellomyces hirtus]|nr:hypothetical protein DFJ77DRAFT_202338 [Powellomyces hirtus]
MADNSNMWAAGSSDDPFAVPASRPPPPAPPASRQPFTSSTAAGKPPAAQDSPGGFPVSAEEMAAYTHFYKLADPQNKTNVQPQDAVAFLSKSRLPQSVLSEIWQQADSDRKGYLTQSDFWKSLKMIALAQSGQSPNVSLLATPTTIPIFEGVAVPNRGLPGSASANPISSHLSGSNSNSPSQFTQQPSMSPIQVQRTGGGPPPVSAHSTGGSHNMGGPARIVSHTTGNSVATHLTGGAGQFVVTPEEKERFSAAFASCSPVDGTVSGAAARDLFMKSNLPLETLGKIWTLVDTSSNGILNLAEFMVAMYIITKLRQGTMTTVPAAVPAELWTAVGLSQRATAESGNESPGQRLGLNALAPPPASGRPLSRMSTMVSGPPSPRMDRRRTIIGTPAGFGGSSVGGEWAIKDEEKMQFDQYFDNIDRTKKGFVTGQESYELFLKAKLPQADLAKIWDLADISKAGHLKKDEFAIAMHLIRSRMTGAPLPQTLPAELVPPAMRQQQQNDTFGNLSGIRGLMQSSNNLNQNAAPEIDLMGGEFASTSSAQAAALPAPPATPAALNLSFSNLPSAHEVADFQDRERDLANRKNDLKQVEGQFEILQPTVEELRTKRAEIDAEYKAVTDKRNELALSLSQLRAVYETESHIAMETENGLRREQQMVQINAAELQQAEQTVVMLQSEKHQLEEQLQRTIQENEEMKRQIKEYTDACLPLRSELEHLRAELHTQVQHRQVNEKLLSSSQAEYQQIHGDVTAEQASLEREKARNLHTAQQIAVQSGINERERQRLQAITAEKEQEQAKAKAMPVPVATPAANAAAASAPQNLGLAGMGAISNLDFPSPIMTVDTRTQPTANGVNSPATGNVTSTPTTPAAGPGTPIKKPPPRPPAAKKPQRGEPVTPLHGVEISSAHPVLTPDAGGGSSVSKPTELARQTSTPKLLSSQAPPAVVQRVNSQSSLRSTGTAGATSTTTTKSALDEFESLFEMNKPKAKKTADGGSASASPVITSASGVKPSPAVATAAPAPAGQSPVAAQRSPSPLPGTLAPPLPPSPTKKAAASPKAFSLGFEPRKDAGGNDSAAVGYNNNTSSSTKSSSASVRSLPLLDKVDAPPAVGKTGGGGALSAPLGSVQVLNDEEGEQGFGFSTAPGSLSALSGGESSARPSEKKINDDTHVTDRLEQTSPVPLDQAFGVGSADQAAGFSTPAFEADFASAFSDIPPTSAPVTHVAAPKSSGSSTDAQQPPPIEPVDDEGAASTSSMKRDGTFASISDVDIEEEMKNAFADTPLPSSASTGSPSKQPADFDDTSFGPVTAKDFDDDAFSFDASFRGFDSPAASTTATSAATNGFPGFDSSFSPSGRSSSTATKPSEFDADFSSAFGNTSNSSANSVANNSSDPFAASGFSFGAPLPTGSSPMPQMSAADMDAVFGGGSTSIPNNTSTATGAFDDAFGSPDVFGNGAFPPAPASTASAISAAEVGEGGGSAKPKRPVPAPPKRNATQDDAEEVRQIVALGFSKDQAVNALELNEFDVARATNYLLDAK